MRKNDELRNAFIQRRRIEALKIHINLMKSFFKTERFLNEFITPKYREKMLLEYQRFIDSMLIIIEIAKKDDPKNKGE